uniref:PH domain-containing protein n=2 Tax=Macrostomum lignano TaxID=282301 RepID=A0A1I8I492_9PLAT
MSLPRGTDFYDFHLDNKVQHHGFLLKRSHLSNKWQRRFCIIKEGFLLVFKEQEAERIKRSSFYNVKVNAAIPLGDCVINLISDATVQCGIDINIFVPSVRFLFSCENRSNQQDWYSALSDASRITHANFQISDKLIATLESQGMEKVTQSERYRKMLEEEVELRHNESEKASRLEAQQTELQQEKEYAELAMRELESELAALRSEMTDAQTTLERTREEKAALEKRAKQLLEQENQRAGDEESQDNGGEELAKLRREVEEKIREKSALASALEGERSAFDQQAQELSNAVRQLSEQRARASAELAAEQRARQLAEARLREAENSLARLHASVSEERSVYTPEQKEEMKADVGQLKAYFENLIASKSADSGAVKLRRSSRLQPQQQQQQQQQVLQQPEQQQQPFLVRARSQRLRERHRSRLSCMQPSLSATAPVSPLAN